MRHPIEKYNQNQAAVLASLPEDQRDYMARMFRIGNATYCYHNQVKDLAVFGKGGEGEQPATDLIDWMEQQINPMLRIDPRGNCFKFTLTSISRACPMRAYAEPRKQEDWTKPKLATPFVDTSLNAMI